MARYNTARVTVDLSPAQRAALDEMISKYNTEVGKVLGLELRIGMGEFVRALIKQHDADAVHITALESALVPLIHHAEWAARYNPELQGAVNEARAALRGDDAR